MFENKYVAQIKDKRVPISRVATWQRHFSVAGAAPPQALPAVFGSVGSLHTPPNCETKQTNNLSVVRESV